LNMSQWASIKQRWDHRPMALGLERVVKVLAQLERQTGLALIKPNAIIITVGGTNGKGSTCAMLEAILGAAGYKTGCYTSPDLISFRERMRLSQELIDDAALDASFAAVAKADTDTVLTPFEAETLAAFHAFASQALDVWILEVGLGGRLDAVNAIDADCSIVTCVDIDHAAILGSTREAIGIEKAHIYRAGKPAICVDPVPPQSLLDYAKQIGADLWLFGRDFNFSGDRQQWSYGGRTVRRNSMAYPALRGANQLLNASGALAALEALRERLPVSAQAVRQGLSLVEIPGRFQVLAGRPVVVLDVAHNPHAAAHLSVNLDQMGFFPYTYAVFGMLADKDIESVIHHLKSKIDHWLVCDLSGPRASSSDSLAAKLALCGVIEDAEHSIEQFKSPRLALARARERAGENDRILVFGSFLTVADVLSDKAIS
jgi:dihydrofolate synthase / folylpolyglutamate synthase